MRFLLIARMLWDKGIGEYDQASRILKTEYDHVECCLLGVLDDQNPSAITQKQMNDWVEEGIVEYLGVTDDIRPYIMRSDCVVLPSYREGTPRSLLEAAAMCRPIVTTNTVGCKDVVDDGLSGYLCNVRDPIDLADKMRMIMELTPEERKIMGMRGRRKIEKEYDEVIVIDKYFEAIRTALSK